MGAFDLEILAPEGIKYHDSVEALKVWAQDGQMEVLAHHAPLLALLKAGKITVVKAGEIKDFEAQSGVLEVKENKAIVLIT
jgi:F-type H+-transporting ATPase subunit epsilon